MAIPYATWANRGRGQMTVWLARTDAAARPDALPDDRDVQHVTLTAAAGRGKNMRTIIDGEEPRNSAEAGSYFDWWPRAGLERRRASSSRPRPGQGQRRQCSKGEWIEMTFAKPSDGLADRDLLVRRSASRGGVRVPASWKLLYKDGERVEAGRDDRRDLASPRTPRTR